MNVALLGPQDAAAGGESSPLTNCYSAARGKQQFIAEQKVRVWVAGQMAT